MVDHIGLRVKDLEKAKQLYTAILAPLGHVPGAAGDGYAGFGPKEAPALWLHGTKKGGGAHVALRAATRDAVDKFYAEGLKAGAMGNGVPGLRTDYGPTYYATFLMDAHGNNVEAVCLR